MVCKVTSLGVSGSLARVVRARRAEGFSVAGLARRAGVSQPLVSNWLCGRRALSLESIDALRVALGIGWCELLPCASCPLARVAAPPRLRVVA